MFSLVSCGKFDHEKADYSEYIKAFSPADITLDMIKDDYEASRKQIAQTYSQFNVYDSYAMDFKVSANIIGAGENDKETKSKYLAWSFDTDENYIKNYYVGKDKEKRDFDNAIIYNITKTGDISDATYRTVTYGTEFTFRMDIPADYAKEEVAGKTVAFTITPVAVYTSIYADPEIIFGVAEALSNISGAEKAEGETVALGDIITLDYKGTLNGEAFNGGSYEDYTMRLGFASFVAGFEDAIVGHKVGETFTIDVTFPEKYSDDSLAGKETRFEITLHKAYRFSDEFVKENTDYDTMWDFKNAMRLQYHAMYVATDILCDKSEVIKYPSSLLSSYKYIFKTEAENQVNYYYKNYYQSQGYTLKQTAAEMFPNGGIKTYAETKGKQLVLKDLVCSDILRKNNVEIDAAKFQGYIDYLCTTLNTGDSVQYTADDLINNYGKDRLLVDAKSYFSAQVIYSSMTCLPFAVAYVVLY